MMDSDLMVYRIVAIVVALVVMIVWKWQTDSATRPDHWLITLMSMGAGLAWPILLLLGGVIGILMIVDFLTTAIAARLPRRRTEDPPK